MREGRLESDIGRLFDAAREASGTAAASVTADPLAFEGLAALARALENSARGEVAALRAARREISVWIQTYVGYERAGSPTASCVEVPVAVPLFIVAFGRTGSTLLHHALSLAQGARAPRLWELWSPSPPSAAVCDDRVESARRRIEFLGKTAPLVRGAHPMDAGAPDECHWMMRHSPLWVMLYDVPDYWAWLKALSTDELRQLYAHYRLQVQHLLLYERGTWVSKAFSHLHFLPVLHDVFPDARLVRLHRDPTAAVPSLCSLARAYRSIFSRRVEPAAIGAGILDLFCDGMARSMALDRARPEAPAVDVHYDELVADPAGTVRRVHERLGYPHDAALDQAMRDYLDRAARLPRYEHRYSLEEFGLSRAEVLDRSAEYLAWAEARCGRKLVG
jgi:hypothetical protein